MAPPATTGSVQVQEVQEVGLREKKHTYGVFSKPPSDLPAPIDDRFAKPRSSGIVFAGASGGGSGDFVVDSPSSAIPLNESSVVPLLPPQLPLDVETSQG